MLGSFSSLNPTASGHWSGGRWLHQPSAFCLGDACAAGVWCLEATPGTSPGGSSDISDIIHSATLKKYDKDMIKRI